MRSYTWAFMLSLLLLAPSHASHAKTIEQIPHLKSLPDSTRSLQQRIERENGNLLLTQGSVFRITKPLVFDLAKHGAVAIRASRGVTIVMDGAGPAFRFVGTHEGTAAPKSFQPATWNERMPLISGIEILGNHAEADGIELIRTVGAVVRNVSVRWCRHAIHLVDRNRNVIVSHCHLYENGGIGLYLDDVNLHQINVSGSHISYNRAGGVVVRDGNVRNLQLTGCDIEGNMPADTTPTKTANVLLDVSGSPNRRDKSIAEVSITGCTIQHAANYGAAADKTVAPGGANIRLAGKKIYPIDSVTITGNVLSDTSTNVDIEYAQDVAINGNNFFAPKPANLHVRHARRVVVVGNTFNPRQFERPGTILFEHSADCIVSSSTLHRFKTDAGALILRHCQGFTINAVNFTDCGSGLVLQNVSDSTISNCRVARTMSGGVDLSIDRSSQDIRLVGNAFKGRTNVATTALSDVKQRP